MKALIGPIECHAIVSRDQAEILARFDHCWIKVNGRLAILVGRFCLESPDQVYRVTALENPAPKHATDLSQVRGIILRHPKAPVDIQALVDTLHFSRELTASACET
jgi:hypothetical protein